MSRSMPGAPPSYFIRRILRHAPTALTALWFTGCTLQNQPLLQQIHARGQLRVVTVNSPTTYYQGAQGPQGLEYRLALAFAKKIGVQLVVQQVRDSAAMRAVLAEGRADLAAAQITAGPEWKRVGLVSASYENIPQLVIQQRSKSHPKNIGDLRGKRIVVRTDSPQLQMLRDLQANGAPYLSWTELPPDEADPIDWVSSADADYAILDENEFGFAQHLYPEAVIAFALPDARPVQWIVHSGANDLRDAVNEFFDEARNSGLVARLEHAASDESRDFDYIEARQFQDDIATRLPQLQRLFEQAGHETGLDWRLLAAIGYQESRWDAKAQSSDGALGIMMLTTDAAQAVGISDRSDAKQNILGGAKYLAQVLDTVPKRIAEPDRTWLALAAYNVGYGHLEDARVLAQMRGKNPDLWLDVREVLPLLAQEQWYARVKRGYARGWEPARFVEQVRQYLAVLEWIGAGTLARAGHVAPASPTVSAAPALKELTQQRAALLRQDAAKDIHAMVETS